MQVDGALQRGSTTPRRRRLNVLLAIVVMAVTAAPLVWAGALAPSGVGVKGANPKRPRTWAAPLSTITRGTCPVTRAPLLPMMTRGTCTLIRVYPPASEVY